jgi:hypothetical protein
MKRKTVPDGQAARKFKPEKRGLAPSTPEPRPEPIPHIERRHRNEWLLIKVLEVDEFQQAKTGLLVAHSKNRQRIGEQAMEVEGDIMVVYSGPICDKGVEVLL